VACTTHGIDNFFFYSENVKIQNHFGDRDGDGRVGSWRNLIGVWAAVSGSRMASGGEVFGTL